MLEETRGLVLRRVRTADESVIVDVFTEARGCAGFSARSLRGRRGGAGAAQLRPMSLVELSYDYRPTRRLQSVREARVDVNYRSVPYDPLKQAVALFLSEFLYHALRGEVANPALFRYLRESMLWLDGASEGAADFHLVLLVGMTRFLGFWPNARGARRGGVFDLREGAVSPVPPLHPDWLCPEETAALPLLLRTGFAQARHLRLNGRARSRALEAVTAYYRLHVPEFPELRSPGVLREMLS